MNRQYSTLVKREFWEHRSLWIAPLVVAGIGILITIVGAIAAHAHFNVDNAMHMGRLGRSGDNPVLAGLFGTAAPLFVVSCITIVVYLLDCLYAERKDRSILFWKSLPVSDALTVLSKFAVAMVLVPLAVYLLTVVSNAVMGFVLSLGIPGFAKLVGVAPGDWLQAQGSFLGITVATVLWYAPLGAWFMLASVVARRAPILWACLPFVVLGVIESVFFGTRYIARLVAERLQMRNDFWSAIVQPELWLGLVAAAGILYMVIRLRRYRDDT